MKTNEMHENNYYYIVCGKNKGAVASFKPGTTQQEKVSYRINRIRYKEPDMHLYAYITIYNTSKARLEAMEHEIKADLFDAGFEHLGNDHFKFTFAKGTQHKKQYQILSWAVMAMAVKYCESHSLDYEVTFIG